MPYNAQYYCAGCGYGCDGDDGVVTVIVVVGGMVIVVVGGGRGGGDNESFSSIVCFRRSTFHNTIALPPDSCHCNRAQYCGSRIRSSRDCRCASIAAGLRCIARVTASFTRVPQ